MSSQWKLVPVEPTETMVINGFESVPDECFSDDEIWEQYQEMSGCQQAAFRAKLCWAAMLAAAPVPPQADLDRVTAERDAALGREAAFNRQISNQAETIKQLSGRYGPIAEALQQRLTAADERAAVLEGLLRKSLRSLVPRMSPALIQDIKAALKPAEGGGDE